MVEGVGEPFRTRVRFPPPPFLLKSYSITKNKKAADEAAFLFFETLRIPMTFSYFLEKKGLNKGLLCYNKNIDPFD